MSGSPAMNSSPNRSERPRPPHQHPTHHQGQPPDSLSRLLNRNLNAHGGPCDHGTFSPRAESPYNASQRGTPAHGGSGSDDEEEGLIAKRTVSRSATGRWGDEEDEPTWGSKDWWTYYLPVLRWVRSYRREYLVGDIVAGITLASIYIPISLSLSSNLAHLPALHGLYSFAMQPLIYALLGSCQTMAVGPEAAGSLLLGNAIRLSDAHHNPLPGETDEAYQARLAGIITATAGAIILAAGFFRMGFLDGVLSRSFLRGFISAVGWVIVVDQLIPELGLQKLAKRDKVADYSSVDKLVWIGQNLRHTHKLTALVSLVSFSIIILGRFIKKRLQKRFPSIVFMPDRLLVVILSIVLTGAMRWDEQGLAVLGSINRGDITPQIPFKKQNLKDIKETMSTSFLIAVLGFFESVVAAKSIEAQERNVQSAFSSNRDMVALGVSNLVGGVFQTLPAFGGYGRSKLNVATGGKTPLSNIILSLTTIVCIRTLLPSLYFLPRGVLSAMLSAIAVSLLEEAPQDLSFFIRIKGYSELLTVLLIFLTTAFFSLELGIAIGVGISLISVLKSTHRPRITILGYDPHSGSYVSAEDHPETEEIEGVLIVKIPEPLTFANTGQLRGRLDRLERYGTLRVHPSRPRRRSESMSQNIIFDIHGVTSLDGSGAAVLLEIVQAYRTKGVRVYFTRVPGRTSQVWNRLVRSGVVDVVGEHHFLRGVEEALALIEREEEEERRDV